MWIARPAAVAGLCAALVWVFTPEKETFAQAVQAIDQAETVTWTTTFYAREYSEDGQRRRLQKSRRLHEYREPGLYRSTDYDDEGGVSSIEITDGRIGKTLRLEPGAKKAVWTSRPASQFGNEGPFEGVRRILESMPLELIGRREIDGRTVNVFRYRQPQRSRGETIDIWLDVKSKQLVGYSTPGADVFDPATDPDRNNPDEGRISKGEMAGSVTHEIVYDAKLDPSRFSFEPPEGFTVVNEVRPTVTEAEVVEWLEASARFNGGVFPDTGRGVELEQYNKAATKAKADRTPVEQRLVEITHRHLLNGNLPPLYAFTDRQAVSGSARYLGKGVKLGDAGRIVCWYRLKGSEKYRAVYGDLSVKEVAAEELPLPVE